MYRCRWPRCKRYVSAPGYCRPHRQQVDRDRNQRSPYVTREWRRLSQAVTARDGRCQVPSCGSTSRLVAHHLENRREGGPDAMDNLVTLCASCHSRYEADRRAGRRTALRRAVESLRRSPS